MAVVDHDWGKKVYSEMIGVQNGKQLTGKGALVIFKKDSKFFIKFPSLKKDVHGRTLNVWILTKGIKNVEQLSSDFIQGIYKTLQKTDCRIAMSGRHLLNI